MRAKVRESSPGEGLAVVNLSTKFDISIPTGYEDMKGTQNIENGVVWPAYLGVTERRWKQHFDAVRKSCYWPSIITMSMYSAISEL